MQLPLGNIFQAALSKFIDFWFSAILTSFVCKLSYENGILVKGKISSEYILTKGFLSNKINES